jgi:hypothetical protein|tara:strand:- start:365 stop:559 length:195 start_codon:yes stop_codon:yes gene_type:complete
MCEMKNTDKEIIKAANTLVWQWHQGLMNNQFAEHDLWKAVAKKYETTKADRKWLHSRHTKLLKK